MPPHEKCEFTGYGAQWEDRTHDLAGSLNFCVILIVAPVVLRHGEVGLIGFLGLVLRNLATTLQIRLNCVTKGGFCRELHRQLQSPLLLLTQLLPLEFALLRQQLFMRLLLIPVAITTSARTVEGADVVTLELSATGHALLVINLSSYPLLLVAALDATVGQTQPWQRSFAGLALCG